MPVIRPHEKRQDGGTHAQRNIVLQPAVGRFRLSGPIIEKLLTAENRLTIHLDAIIRLIVLIPYSVEFIMSWADLLVTFNHQFLAAPIQLVSFWLSVSLPLVYIPILLHGLKHNHIPTFLGFLVLHGLTLFLGHGHGDNHGRKHHQQEA